jgi:hypothetical protein
MRLKLIPYDKDKFFINEEADRFIFTRGEGEKVNGMEVRHRLGPEERAIKIDKPLPEKRQSVLLEPGMLPNYTGVFELAPGMAITIGLLDGNLYAQTGGQEKLTLQAESPLRLFAREVEMTFGYEFDDLGKATKITLYQASQSFICRRVG